MANEISGTAVFAAALGAFAIYAGVKNVPFAAGLRQVASGSLPAGTPQKVTQTSTSSTAGSSYSGSGNISGPFPSLAQAAMKYVGLPYSQNLSLRLGPTAFDCSGLVWRCFMDIGIKAPTTTFTQQPWSELKTISAADCGAGDLVFWPGHVVIAISNTEAIGAENPRTGVIRGLISQMGVPGTGATYKRYTGVAVEG